MQPGTIIQNYRLVHLLGEGGMGSVWLAAHLQLNRQVAIKCLNPALFRNPAVRTRFRQEAVALAQLQHPNIVNLLDYYEDAQGAYLVMEYVPGMALDDFITERSGPITGVRLENFLRQMLAGLAYVHQKGILHRDIKPGNFMVGDDGTVKVLDFGIAKLLEAEDHKLTKTGTHIGTVLYMSPEQVKGFPVDVRSDVYSLGVTLFQMATGRCPYDKEHTEFVVYDQIVNHPFPDAKAFYPPVSPHIEALIATATAKDPAARFQDCGEFLAALENPDYRAVASTSTLDTAGSISEAAAALPTRSRKHLWTRGAGLLMFAALFVMGYFLIRNNLPTDTDDRDASSSRNPVISSADDSDIQAERARQRRLDKEEAERKRRKAEEAAAAKRMARGSAYQSLRTGHDGYSIGILGGISGLTVVIANNTDFLFDQIDVAVEYVKADGYLYDTEIVSFPYVGAHDSARMSAPDKDRGTSVQVRIYAATSREMEYCYDEGTDVEGMDDPYHCQ